VKGSCPLRRTVLLLTLILVGGPLAAQQTPPAEATPPEPPATVPQQSPGPSDLDVDFEFEDEPAETFGQILAPQVLDLVLLSAFFALALVSFFRKNVALKYVTLVLAVGYLGFAKSYLISVVNLFGLVDWSWPEVKYSLGWYLLAGFTVGSTILWGRFYCGRVCAFGALTQILDAIVPARLRVELPAAIGRPLAWTKYALLVGVVAYYLLTRDLMVYRYVEPFWMFGLSESAALWAGLGVLLVATVFVRNLYCRYLCPVGAFLGVLSALTLFRIKRWSECGTCRICEKTCLYDAIRGPRILVAECVRCDDCERVYADSETCPHWLIPVRRLAKGLPALPRAPGR